MARHARTASLLLLLLVIGGAIYVASGVEEAYLAADDFQWLEAGRTFTWSRVLYVSRQHFYRPVVDAWFGGAVADVDPRHESRRGGSSERRPIGGRRAGLHNRPRGRPRRHRLARSRRVGGCDCAP